MTQQSLLLKTAAGAGAKAGFSFGKKLAMTSGKKAGEEAGTLAGMQAGASAGAKAGEKAAIETMTEALEEALNSFHGDNLHKFKINVKDGRVVSVTGPGIGEVTVKRKEKGIIGGKVGEGGGGKGGSVGEMRGGVRKAAGRGKSGGAEAGGNGGGREEGGKGGRGGEATKEVTTGEVAGSIGSERTEGGWGSGGTGWEGAEGLSVTSNAGKQSAFSSNSSAIARGGINAAAGKSAGRQEKTKTNYTPYRDVTYIPKVGELPQEMARSLVWRVGAASKSEFFLVSFNLQNVISAIVLTV